MIYGIGTDLCDVGRIEKSIARPAFLQHVYTPAEQELIVAHTGKKQAETAAANFAAKEAFLKACGTGLSGFSMAEIAACASQAVRLTWNLPVKPPVSWRRTICRLI